ncbi:MAG TPA: response regulator transcription factor [Marmoricola sp.]|nr:response regulator transcription factor [Marmoricola sp.]
MSTDPIRLLLADDRAWLRQQLAAALAGQPGLDVVGQAGNTWRALALAHERAPHVVVAAAYLPRGGAVLACRQLRGLRPAPRVLVLAEGTHGEQGEDEAVLLAALRAGAHGCLTGTATVGDLLEAVRAVAEPS